MIHEFRQMYFGALQVYMAGEFGEKSAHNVFILVRQTLLKVEFHLLTL